MIDVTDGDGHDWLALHRLATTMFTETLAAVHDFSAPTACRQWDATDLVRHVICEQMWVPGLLAGGTLDEVADDLQRPLRRLAEQSGEELVHTWSTMTDAVAAAWRGTRPEAAVEMSYGRAAARHYLAQQTADTAIHAWDLGVGQQRVPDWDDALAAALVDFLDRDLAGNPATEWFAAPVPGYDTPDTGARERALALTGRDPLRPLG